MTTRAAVGLVGLLLAVATASCAGRRPPATGADAGGTEVGLYRARVVDSAGESHRFRLWLYAAAPDSLHGEILSPTSSPVLILDAGDDRVALTVVRDRVAFVGPADAAFMQGILGLRVSLRGLVGLLTDGSHVDDELRVTRDPPRGGGLPDRLEINAGGSSLGLELKRRQALRGDPAELGRGVPPSGMEIRPLEEFGSSGYAMTVAAGD